MDHTKVGPPEIISSYRRSYWYRAAIAGPVEEDEWNEMPELMDVSEDSHAGTLPSPQGTGTVGTPGEGNFVQMFISVTEGHITAARFRSFTCPVALAACDVTAEMARGMSLEQARQLSPEVIADALGGMPEEKMNRCQWAVSALHAAVNHCLARTTTPSATNS